ncbi:MAG: glycerate kinase [Gammaproteobacteria bacterium]
MATPVLRDDAMAIIRHALAAVLPEAAVKARLRTLALGEPITLVAIGKAAWRMAQAAKEELGDAIRAGVVITKYDHSLGDIPGIEIFEAGHPLPDVNGIRASEHALALVEALGEQDTVLFLVSGGGSALFEQPAAGLTLDDFIMVTDALLRCGADIVEINTLRKRLSQVKGGRFAQRAAPARVVTLVLSDVLGDRLDSIASGPAYPDSTTATDALQIVAKYRLALPEHILDALRKETPKTLANVETHIVGSVRIACEEAAHHARRLGYHPLILTTTLNCEAREAGRFLAAIAREVAASDQPAAKPCVLIAGGETVVQVKGQGRGGLNQELALAAAGELAGTRNIVIAAVGTDGTDGPTDAAGGLVDGQTKSRLSAENLDLEQMLADNNAYAALTAAGDLLKTGPTGTNVNDLALALII